MPSSSASRLIAPPRTRNSRRNTLLPFPLLADEDHAVAEAYGAWGEKSMYGRKYKGILRTTYLIDGNGSIAEGIRESEAQGPRGEVLEALETLP